MYIIIIIIMTHHFMSVCRSVCLNNIDSLKRLLSKEALVTIVRALITSRINYCNSFGMCDSERSINRFQRIQNTAACTITGASEYDTNCKTLLSTKWSFKALRSSILLLLNVPVTQLKSYRGFTFCVAVPTLGNALPWG